MVNFAVDKILEVSKAHGGNISGIINAVYGDYSPAEGYQIVGAGDKGILDLGSEEKKAAYHKKLSKNVHSIVNSLKKLSGEIAAEKNSARKNDLLMKRVIALKSICFSDSFIAGMAKIFVEKCDLITKLHDEFVSHGVSRVKLTRGSFLRKFHENERGFKWLKELLGDDGEKVAEVKRPAPGVSHSVRRREF